MLLPAVAAVVACIFHPDFLFTSKSRFSNDFLCPLMFSSAWSVPVFLSTYSEITHLVLQISRRYNYYLCFIEDVQLKHKDAR